MVRSCSYEGVHVLCHRSRRACSTQRDFANTPRPLGCEGSRENMVAQHSRAHSPFVGEQYLQQSGLDASIVGEGHRCCSIHGGLLILYRWSLPGLACGPGQLRCPCLGSLRSCAGSLLHTFSLSAHHLVAGSQFPLLCFKCKTEWTCAEGSERWLHRLQWLHSMQSVVAG